MTTPSPVYYRPLFRLLGGVSVTCWYFVVYFSIHQNLSQRLKRSYRPYVVYEFPSRPGSCHRLVSQSSNSGFDSVHVHVNIYLFNPQPQRLRVEKINIDIALQCISGSEPNVTIVPFRIGSEVSINEGELNVSLIARWYTQGHEVAGFEIGLEFGTGFEFVYLRTKTQGNPGV